MTKTYRNAISLAAASLVVMVVSNSLAAAAIRPMIAASAIVDAAPSPAPDAVVAVVSAGSGSAVTVAVAMPDPVAAPGEAVSMLMTLWKSGAIAAMGIVGLFFGLQLASRWISWFRSGKRRNAITASSLMFLATIAEPASRGTTPTMAMMLAGLGTAIALFVKMDAAKSDDKAAA